MLANLGPFLQTALTVLTLASLAGLGLMRGTVVGLRESLADARAKITDLERDRVEDRAKITSQNNDIDTLRRVATGAVQWEAIATKLDQHHSEAKRHWKTDEELLGLLLQAIQTRGGGQS